MQKQSTCGVVLCPGHVASAVCAVAVCCSISAYSGALAQVCFWRVSSQNIFIPSSLVCGPMIVEVFEAWYLAIVQFKLALNSYYLNSSIAGLQGVSAQLALIGIVAIVIVSLKGFFFFLGV